MYRLSTYYRHSSEVSVTVYHDYERALDQFRFIMAGSCRSAKLTYRKTSKDSPQTIATFNAPKRD